MKITDNNIENIEADGRGTSSDHFPVLCTIKADYEKPTPIKNTINIRSHENVVYEALRNEKLIPKMQMQNASKMCLMQQIYTMKN